MTPTSRVMLFIDADNVSADVIAQAVARVKAEHGAIHVRRAHCTPEVALKHAKVFKSLSIRPIVNLASGKNSTDIALAVDAMEMVCAERPQLVVIVSSDSDFAPLVIRLREKGCRVCGIGQEGKTGDEVIGVYDEFIDLAHRKSGASAPASATQSVGPASAKSAGGRGRRRKRGGTERPNGRPGEAGRDASRPRRPVSGEAVPPQRDLGPVPWEEDEPASLARWSDADAADDEAFSHDVPLQPARMEGMAALEAYEADAGAAVDEDSGQGEGADAASAGSAIPGRLVAASAHHRSEAAGSGSSSLQGEADASAARAAAVASAKRRRGRGSGKSRDAAGDATGSPDSAAAAELGGPVSSPASQPKRSDPSEPARIDPAEAAAEGSRASRGRRRGARGARATAESAKSAEATESAEVAGAAHAFEPQPAVEPVEPPAPSEPPRSRAAPAPRSRGSVDAAGTAAPAEGLPADVEQLLDALPELRAGGSCALRQAAERLRQAGLLAKNAPSTKLFRKYPDLFVLTPGRQPNTVRYSGAPAAS